MTRSTRAGQTAPPVIAAHELARWYGQVLGVADVTVEVGAGVTGLLGPNGAGKTTFLKLMVGQLRPSRGQLRILGEPVWGNRRLLARIGYCPEHEGNYRELTGLEFVRFMTELQGFSPAAAERQARQAIAEVELSAAGSRRIAGYSKGMRQRLKLAQALAHRPDVLFLDEPLSGCDPLARNHIIGLIRALGAEGRTVIVSSHVLHEVEAMTSDILLIHKGQILAEGNVHDIRGLIDRHPHHIRIECDRPRELGARLLAAPEIASVGIEEGALVVETHQPDACYPAIPRLAREAGIRIAALTSPDDNLQAVFRYLTEERLASRGHR